MSEQLVPLSKLAAGLTFETRLKPAADIGVPGEFAMIEPSKLYIDQSYQRPIMESGKKNIRRVNEQFHYAKFGALIVTRRGRDRYAVLDGQHHGIAAALHPKVKKVPCLIQKCTPEQEADVFATVNTLVTRVHPLHLFRARVASGDKSAGAVARACRAADVTICPYPKTDLQPGETLAPGRIEGCIERYGAEVTTLALQLVTRSKAKDGNAGLLIQGIIVGFAATLFANPRWRKLEPCLRALEEKGVRDIAKRAALRQAQKGGSLAASAGVLLAELLAAKIGAGGGDQVKGKTLKQQKREGDRRRGEVLRAMERSKPAAPPRVSNAADEQAAIAAFLKDKAPRRFESGATGDSGHLMDWLHRECGITCRRLPRAGAKAGRIYEVGRRKVDLHGLIDIVNGERGKRKLQPITSG